MPIFLISDIQQTFWMIAEFGIKNHENCISGWIAAAARASSGAAEPGLEWSAAMGKRRTQPED
jgi:hypothetical protein